MSQILIIETNKALGSGLASALRQQRFQVKKHKDVLDGLRELAWFSAKLIIWETNPNDRGRLKKFQAIRQYRQLTPLIILEDTPQLFTDSLDSNTFIYHPDTLAADLVKKAVELLGIPNTQEFEDYENEIMEEAAY
jgi:DNA-binding NtrC family response regulator